MNKVATKLERIESDPIIARRLLIAAQLLALVAYGLGLQFLMNTTGGTLFVFSVIAPALVAVGIAVLLGVLAWKFLRSHSLFYFEEFDPGQFIFQQGDTGDCAYFIHSGEVEVVTGSGGQEQLVAKLQPGQYFGEMALITSHPRNATVRATTKTTVAVLGKENFLTLVSVIPSTREDIMNTVNKRAMQQAAGLLRRTDR
ncbi:MAG: cyclic nucleotide-binding domain-containing protein [Acidobacteriia bacterium]|nr:cyclic nucleotide-binding domain-containing protein [Terriglobia bacterium]